ncbi:hypothetical protein [Streptomyces buecherae]|uniref:hypothetical protein n=1 Tax=Streptomyces buecherae TaxID=2763006 RepID=UPI001E3272C2|nr:hypothetical protein [Streptomyces buecherae]
MASAITAPASTALRIARSRRAGNIRARMTAGNIASSPSASVSWMTFPASAPSIAPAGQQISMPRPHTQ